MIDGMERSPVAALASIARRQAGTFSAPQARTCGVTAGMLRRRERHGEVEQLDDDVWCFGSAPPGWLRDRWAATLVHPRAALSHRTAAASLGLDVDPSRPLHVTVPLDADHRSRSVQIHRSRHHRFAIHDGLRVTRFEQILVQLAAAEPDLVRSVLHAGVDREPLRLDRLLRHLDRLSRARLPGLRGLRALALDVEGEPPTQSELERRLLDICAAIPGMPAVHRQAPAPWSPESRSVVDGLVHEWNLILEADGRVFHERRAAFEQDRWRDAEAAVHGFFVMRFTYRRMEHDRAGIVDQLQRYGQRIRRAAA